jgi:hypothetical protein
MDGFQDREGGKLKTFETQLSVFNYFKLFFPFKSMWGCFGVMNDVLSSKFGDGMLCW